LSNAPGTGERECLRLRATQTAARARFDCGSDGDEVIAAQLSQALQMFHFVRGVLDFLLQFFNQ
jgi:hypothetical protein